MNENYIVIILEFKDERKLNNESLLVSLKGDENLYNLYIENGKKVKFQNILKKIDLEFNKEILKRKEEIQEDPLLYPIDFSIVKKITHTHEAESYKFGKRFIHTRFINKPPEIMIIYKYMGLINYIEDYIKILDKKFKLKEEEIFIDIDDYKVFLCSESNFLEEILNQNYFLVYMLFKGDIKADPNDFRRSLLGIERKYNTKRHTDSGVNYIYKRPSPDILNDIRKKFLGYVGTRSLNENEDYVYPIKFSIIKKPTLLYTDRRSKKPHNISNRAAGVMILYKYLGPINQTQNFRKALVEVFNNKYNSKVGLFKRIKKLLILIGAELNLYKNF